ncbi:EcsC family protein [Nocardioides sp. ChNu-153]|uniref:EcsC family protein n=1 Tax=unclassified Nocardioides TaxID=2615069 RepID=UPI0024051505|nr:MULTISPECIES: EcsC family protein [unclassified Nocardioides]MDF9718028.1 EcsC family protein [Nocardioides sp. ChNu-99]MDN7123032.1 EcsC family protein [Nocardioides sp. ChNu-153]
MGIKQKLGSAAAAQVPAVAPNLTANFVRQALARAIDGVGPLKPAAVTAQQVLDEHDGDVEAAVKAVIEKHVRLAGAQGFLTNVGGLVTVAVTIPANITGLAVIQCRMIATLAHLRGYDLADPRVRNAILACLMGPAEVDRMLKKKKLPAPPMALATAPQHDPELDRKISNEVATDLISRVVGKRLAVTIGRRVPVVGGAVGLTADGMSTWKIGRYAAKELRARHTGAAAQKA